MKDLRKLDRFFRRHPLTRDARSKAWMRFLSWQIRSRLQQDIVMPWVLGQKLVVQNGMTGATGNIYAGLHEFADMALVLHFLRSGDYFADVGANIGSFTVLASGVCRAKTFAFEPDPGTSLYLSRNIQINDIASLVDVYEIAVGDRCKDVEFTVGLDTVNRVVVGQHRSHSRLVKQMRLDDVLKNTVPAMIKVDVEGYEEKVISGALSTLMKEEVKIVELETVSPCAEKVLESIGFSRRFYDPFSRSFGNEGSSVSSSNACFIRDECFVNSRVRSADRVEVLGISF
ncbi:FkbM family methyltransferase [Mesorhizobium tianshanense]|nr:FkbM family methyltransferase [Mesorhizobium tianshanense]